MKRILFLLLAVVCALSLAACVGNKPDTGTTDTDTGGENDGKIKVLLTFDEKITVTSQNPVYVDEGDNAEFEISIADQFTIDTLSHGEYRGGKVRNQTLYSRRGFGGWRP